MNETLTSITSRYSCKAFADDLPDRTVLETIAQAAITSPSATNKQPWQVTVVTDKALLDEMEEETVRRMGELPAYKDFYDMVKNTGMKLFYNAPCMMILPIDKSNPYAPYDCGIISQTICIAAQSVGIASHIIAISEVAFSGEKGAYFKQKLQFPKGYEFGLAVLLGKETVSGVPHETNPDKIIYIK